MGTHRRDLTVAIGAAVLWATSANAGPTDAEKCESFKLKHTAKYAFCRMKTDSNAVKKGEAPDYTKCNKKILDKFDKAEKIWGMGCPTSGDVGGIKSRVTADTNDLMILLSGGMLPVDPGCGDGVVESGEDCDVGDLNGADCISEGFAGGTLACAAGCTFNTSGCWASRYIDNGDGTVTDNETRLMWEQKDNSGGIHDKDNIYSWCADAAPVDFLCDNGGAPDGTVFTIFLGTLNGGTSEYGTTISGCFAGHCDWRLPTSVELQTIHLAPYPCGTHPCIDPIFGPTQSDDYWSATTYSATPDYVFLVNFHDSSVAAITKTEILYVRAVRGGL